MNKFLRQRRERRTCSPLYQKMLMLLLLMVVGVSGAWAQTSYGKVEISEAPEKAGEWHCVTDQGNVKVWYTDLTDEAQFAANNGANQLDDKWYVKLASKGFFKIRVAKGTVAAGDILRVEVRDIYNNGDNQNLGFQVEGSNSTVGITETDNALHTLDYTLKAADIRVDGDDANYDYIQFNRNGNSGCGYHSVEILLSQRYTVSIDLAKFPEGLPKGCDAWFTLNDDATKYRSAQSVPVGTKVTYTTSCVGGLYSPAGWRTKGWQSHDTGWMVWGASFTTTVRSTAEITEDALGCEGDIHVWSNHEKLNYGNVNAAPEFDDLHKTAYTVTVNRSNLPAKCDAWFTIGSDATQYREQQWVAEGTQVTFAMNSEDPHYSPAGFRKTGTSWSSSGDPGWMGFSATLTTTVRSEALGTSGEQGLSGDVSLNPEFTHYYFVKANAEDGGTATVSDANGHDMNKGYEGNTGSLTFTATPNNSLKTFAGWYNGDQLISNENPYNYGVYNNPDKNDLTLTAKFAEKFAVITDQELTHNISLGETLSLHVTAGDSKFTTVDLYEDAELHNKLGFVSFNNPYVFDPEVGVTKGDDPDKGTVLKRGEGTYYLVFRACKSGDGYNFTTDENSVVFTVNVGEKYANTIEEDACGNAYTFWMQQLNAGDENVTITYEDNGAAHVVTNGSGSHVSFKFENAVNLSDMAGWGIGTSNNDAIRSITFYDGDTKIGDRDYYNSIINRTLSDDLKAELTSVTEMRIGIVPNADILINYVQLRIDRKNGILPTLDDPTRTEMELMEGETLKLRIKNGAGYWREYTDGNYNTVKNDRIQGEGDGAAYTPSYDFNLTPGDYYFTAQDGSECKLGHYHLSDQVRVHVKVKSLPSCTIITSENSEDKVDGDGGSHYDWDSGDMYMVYRKEAEGTGRNVTVNVNKTENYFNDNHDGIDCSKSVHMLQSKGTELIVTAPRGYRVEYVKINFCKESCYNVSFNQGVYMPNGTAESIEWTVQNGNNQWDDKCRMVIRGASDQTQCTELHIKDVFVKITRKGSIIDESRQVNGRDYWLYVPSDVAEGKVKNVPVVFSLHGTGCDYQPADDGSDNGLQNFNALADENYFIVVYPRGEQRNFTIANRNERGWYATGNNKDTNWSRDNEDVTYLRNLAKEIKDNFSVDETRFYITGYSNGGMMTYAAANTMPDIFAAYAAVAGFPLNEMHLMHNGNRAVPFLHIHGTADDYVPYDKMPIIIDNMTTRNGLSYVPSTTETVGNYTKYSYTGVRKQPFTYYAVSGMGHQPSASLNGVDSKKIIWDFFDHKALSKITTPNVFEPDLANANAQRGWTINDGATILKYGESGGPKENSSVYHSLQLPRGSVWLKFNATNSDAQKQVKVRLTRLAAVNEDHFLKFSTAGFDVDNSVRFERVYTCEEPIAFPFNVDDEFGGEYMLEILDADGNAGSGTSITNLVFSTEGAESGKLVSAQNNYHNYFYNPNNRTVAQWNFDASDGFRFNVNKLDLSKYWTKDESNAADGYVLYTYNQPIQGIDVSDITQEKAYGELYYNPEAANPEKIPVSAGLKFNAAAGSIKIQTYSEGGVQKKCYLILEDGVKMLVPYVVNSFRNDADTRKQTHKPDEAGQQEYFNNCVHHWKRDILYVAMADGGNIWDYFKNECINDPSLELFGGGGGDFINEHHHFKLDYTGSYGVPCIIQVTKESKIARMNVERNLTYSFYSEYVDTYDETKGLKTPKPGTRIIGSPAGQKVANITNVATDEEYRNSIAFTFGGWLNSDGNSTYRTKDVLNNGKYEEGAVHDQTDVWSDQSVFANGHALTWADLALSQNQPNAGSTVPTASDGFPVFVRLDQPARSEQLMVENPTKYHPLSSGIYNDHNNDGVVTGINYVANKTPWTLPVRGGYMKFEPTLPGVLNVHMLQHAGDVYFIADEFGKTVTSGVYAKPGTEDNMIKKADSNGNFNDNGAGYKLWSKSGNGASTNSDYVKYIFNVYPGKTYYIFSNTFGMGMAGFYYEPFVQRDENATTDYEREYGRIDVGVREVSIDATANGKYTYPTEANLVATEYIQSPMKEDKSEYRQYPIKYSNKAVKVTLNGRTFTADQWNTICLPYSMNRVQVERMFGDKVKLVLLRDVQDPTTDPSLTNTTAHFVHHQHKDIIAGYPYFIKPSVTVTNPTTYACLQDQSDNNGIPELVYIDSKDEKYGNPGEEPKSLAGYIFKGNFEKEFYPNGSYYMGPDNGVHYLQGSEYENGQYGNYLNPYRVRLEYNGAGAGAQAPTPTQVKAYVVNEYGEEELSSELSTAIEDIMLQDGVVSNDAAVFDMSGKKVATDGNLQKLPKGIYIVNGKKYISK